MIVTKGPGIESAALLAALFRDRIDLPDDVLAAADARLEDATPVRDALTASAAGPVTAMHDATERGIDNALAEMAHAAGVRIDVDRDRAPIAPEVARVCDHFDVDPWKTGSAGTLLATVPPEGVDSILSALESEGIDAAEFGVVHEGSGAYADGDPIDVPDRDPFASVYADLRAEGSDE